jgi:dienelactone hydrolase
MTGLQMIRLEHEGAALEGQLAVPDGPGPHPAVLVMHNGHGLGPHMHEVALRLAGLGYLAIASDMFGGGAHFADPTEAGPTIAPLWNDHKLLRARVLAWFDRMVALPGVDATRTAAIGYCFGGQCVLELARSGADTRLVVSYHGMLGTQLPAAPGEVRAHVAVYTGKRDPWVPFDHVTTLRDELLAAGAHWQITEFGDAFHAFTDKHASEVPLEGLAYDPLADAVSWAGTVALLDALVKG